jgi:hypothetical protein
LGESAPNFSFLYRYNDPYNWFTENDADHVEANSDEDAIFDFVDNIEIELVASFPLYVDETCEDAHHVGWGSHVGFVVEFVHELRLWGKFRIWDGISPIVDYNQNKGCDDWS